MELELNEELKWDEEWRWEVAEEVGFALGLRIDEDNEEEEEEEEEEGGLGFDVDDGLDDGSGCSSRNRKVPTFHSESFRAADRGIR